MGRRFWGRRCDSLGDYMGRLSISPTDGSPSDVIDAIAIRKFMLAAVNRKQEWPVVELL